MKMRLKDNVAYFIDDGNLWDEYEISKEKQELIDELLPEAKRADETLKKYRAFILECIKRELWINDNFKEAERNNEGILGEDSIFEFIVNYNLVFVEIMTTDKKLRFLEFVRHGYKYIRSLKSQLFEIRSLDKEYVAELYNQIDDLGLSKFFDLMFADELKTIQKIVKDVKSKKKRSAKK